MDFSKLKFSPTSLPYIMSNSKATLSDTGAKDLIKIREKQIIGKPLSATEEKNLPRLLKQEENMLKGGIILSNGCEKFLTGIYLDERYGSRYKLLKPEVGTGVPQMVRGIKTESQVLKLLCAIDGKQYFKYKKQVENEYLVGKLDVIDAETPDKAKTIFDIKSAKDGISFFSKINEPFTKANIWQMQAYFGITGIEYGEIIHCLTGEPPEVIEEQEQLLFNKMCPDGIKTPTFEAEWSKAKSSMLYDDIPENDRLIGLPVFRDEEFINLIYETIKECRNWLNEYHERHGRFISQRHFEQKNNSEYNTPDMGEGDGE
jgi:hypothetical protein